MTTKILFYLLFILLAAPNCLQAQFSFRSGFFNPPGATDNGYEYIEIQGPVNTGLTGVWLIEIDGDATASGDLDRAVDLSGYATGSNGLLLIRDAVTPILPAPAPATSTVILNFTPDLENGTVTFALVFNCTGIPGTDLDADGDGVLEQQPWTGVLDAVAFTDGNAGDDRYAGALGFPGQNFPEINGPVLDNAEGWALYGGVLYAIDVSTASPPGGMYTVESAWEATGVANAGMAGALVLTPGNTAAPLPVEMLSFRVEVLAEQVLLYWSTAAEYNSVFFMVERSTDGFRFDPLGQLAAAGNSETRRDYHFTDPAPAPGANYYRIRQVDSDGGISLSPMRVVRRSADASLLCFPNPAARFLQVEILAEESVYWQIFDRSSRLLRDGNSEASRKMIQIELGDLPPGVYWLRVKEGPRSKTCPFVKS